MHSNLTDYPNSKSVLVSTEYEMHIGVAIHVTYSVHDKNTIKDLSQCTTEQSKPKWTIYFH